MKNPNNTRRLHSKKSGPDFRSGPPRQAASPELQLLANLLKVASEANLTVGARNTQKGYIRCVMRIVAGGAYNL